MMNRLGLLTGGGGVLICNLVLRFKMILSRRHSHGYAYLIALMVGPLLMNRLKLFSWGGGGGGVNL